MVSRRLKDKSIVFSLISLNPITAGRFREMTDRYFGNVLVTRCDGHVKCDVLLTLTELISDHGLHGFVSVNAAKLLRDGLMDSGCNLSGSG